MPIGIPGADLTGKAFGKLIVQREVASAGGNRCWQCACACGVSKIVRGGDLRSGRTTSCGCVRRKRASASNITHGLSKSRTYKIWKGMKARCANSREPSYKNYGARGIVVCQRWAASFTDFISDMGLAPDGLEIDRINNDGNYEPGNCRWATSKEQCRNTRKNRILWIGGEAMPLAVAAERFGVNASAVSARLNRGWPDELAVFGPPRLRTERRYCEKLPR